MHSRDNVSLCHHISSTRPQGNEIRLHTPTCQSDPAVDGSEARECMLQPYEDTKTNRQLRKVSSLNGQDKWAAVWAKLALFLLFRSPHMSSLNFGADDQVSSVVLFWTIQQSIFKVLLAFFLYKCHTFTERPHFPFFPTTVKVLEGLNLQVLLMNYWQGFSCQGNYAQGEWL